MLTRLSEENEKGLAKKDTGKGQVRVLWMEMRSLKMKQERTGRENSFGESPDEKAEVRVKLGTSQKEEKKKQAQAISCRNACGDNKHFFFFLT